MSSFLQLSSYLYCGKGTIKGPTAIYSPSYFTYDRVNLTFYRVYRSVCEWGKRMMGERRETVTRNNIRRKWKDKLNSPVPRNGSRV